MASGRLTAFPPPPANNPHATTVDVDAENMSLTAGRAAFCRDVAAAAGPRDPCHAMESEGVVADAIGAP